MDAVQPILSCLTGIFPFVLMQNTWFYFLFQFWSSSSTISHTFYLLTNYNFLSYFALVCSPNFWMIVCWTSVTLIDPLPFSSASQKQNVDFFLKKLGQTVTQMPSIPIPNETHLYLDLISSGLLLYISNDVLDFGALIIMAYQILLAVSKICSKSRLQILPHFSHKLDPES